MGWAGPKTPADMLMGIYMHYGPFRTRLLGLTCGRGKRPVKRQKPHRMRRQLPHRRSRRRTGAGRGKNRMAIRLPHALGLLPCSTSSPSSLRLSRKLPGVVRCSSDDQTTLRSVDARKVCFPADWSPCYVCSV